MSSPSRAPGAGDDRRLARLHRAGDRRARELLIERYLPLARSFALRFRHTHEPVDDLIQVAYVGLIKAVDRWEPERGLAFSSYAVPTVLGELRHHLRDIAWMVRPPRDLQELSQSIERERAPLRAAIGREPVTADFAEHLGRTPERVNEALHTNDWRTPTSLDREVADESAQGATIGDYVGGPTPATSAWRASSRSSSTSRAWTRGRARSCTCASPRTCSRPRSRGAWASRRCTSRG